MTVHDDPTAAAASRMEAARATLLAELPVSVQRHELAGIPTSVLEGGDGPPVLLLHDPAEQAAKWFRILPGLLRNHRVIAPDLPGHGTSSAPEEPLDDVRVLRWLDELVEATCPDQPPALVGLILGGAIAARYAVEHGDRLDRLVLVDSLGLAPLAPAPAFAEALQGYLADPDERTHERLWQHCAFDLDGLRSAMGDRWSPFARANLERTRSDDGRRALQELMGAFGLPAIDPADLARIAVPTSLIWGRHDLATPLEVAQAASDRHGWPLHVIDDCADDPTIERPEAFLRALHVALGRTVTSVPS